MSNALAGTARDGEFDVTVEALGLMAAALQCQASKTHSDPIVAFRSLSETVRGKLPKILMAWANHAIGGMSGTAIVRPASGVRNWLRLWLVLEVATLDSTLLKSTVEQKALVTALAFVLREGIRAQLYHGTAGLEVDRDRVTRELVELVAFHASFKNGVGSAFRLRACLRGIQERGRQRWRSGDGHLEHILEAYALGVFFLELRIGKPTPGESAQTLLNSFSECCTDQRSRDPEHLRTVFALATLFHDVGMLLVPDRVQWQEGKDFLSHQALTQAAETIEGAAKALIGVCRRELEIPEEWLAALSLFNEKPQPDHALLSAWYLRTWIQRVPNNAKLNKGIVEDAQRAIILHGALNLTIECKHDPMAALLVFCDELCDWNPSRGEHGAGERSRKLDSDDVSRTPRHGRAREVLLSALSFAIEDERLVGSLDGAGSPATGLSEYVGTSCWPQVEVRLHAPVELDSAVLEIWLRSARNLGRVVAPQHGWLPEVQLTNSIPSRLVEHGLTTLAVLDQVAAERDHALKPWLSNGDFGTDPNRNLEWVRVRPGCWPATETGDCPDVGGILERAEDFIRSKPKVAR